MNDDHLKQILMNLKQRIGLEKSDYKPIIERWVGDVSQDKIDEILLSLESNKNSNYLLSKKDMTC